MTRLKDYKVNHTVKSHPAPFSAVWSGEKMHEIRYNDRGYKVGDIVRLSEWDPNRNQFVGPIGRDIDVIITYLRQAPRDGIDPFGLQPGYCVFDFLILNHFKGGKVIIPSRLAADTEGMSPPPFSTMPNPED